MRTNKKNHQEDSDGDGILKGKGDNRNRKGLDNPEQQACGHRPARISKAPKDGHGKPLDGKPCPHIILGIGNGRHDATRKSPHTGAEDERKGHHIAGIDPTKNRRQPIGGAGPHLAADRGYLEKQMQRRDHHPADTHHPQHLRGNTRPHNPYGRDLIAYKIGQRPDILPPDMDSRLARQNGDTDGDNDHPQYRRTCKPANKDDLDQGPYPHGHNYCPSDGKRKRHKGQKGDGNHPSEHDKLTLGKINNPGSVVNDIKADGDNGIDTAIGDAGKEILDKKLSGHKRYEGLSDN